MNQVPWYIGRYATNHHSWHNRIDQNHLNTILKSLGNSKLQSYQLKA